jgi:hypothetical protein
MGTAVTVLDLASGVAKDIETNQAGIYTCHWLDATTVRYFAWVNGQSGNQGVIKDATTTSAPRVVREVGPVTSSEGGILRGNVAVAGTGVRKPQLFDLAAGTSRPLNTGPSLPPSLSANGKLVLFPSVGAPSALRIYDIDRGSERAINVPFAFASAYPAVWHPDGRHIIVAGISPGSDLTRIFLVPVNGEAIVTLATLPQGQRRVSLAVSPDGKQLVYSEDGPPSGSIGELSLDAILPRAATPAARRP